MAWKYLGERVRVGMLGSMLAGTLSACAEDPSPVPADAVAVGAILPFTGKEAALGRNLEQAMLLAEEDINRAGGVGGRPLAVLSRDSNSGSQRGLDALLELLYINEVSYLIGPEENELASDIVPDIKGLDVLNLLPGYTAPSIERVSNRGAWLRLAPSPAAIGCAIAKQQIQGGVRTANAIVALDDYNQSLAAEFNAQFGALGGTSLSSVTVAAGAGSYIASIQQVLSYNADSTLLIAYPATASAIVTEWQVGGRGGNWDLTPMLNTEVFLTNTPFGALDGYSGLSPSLSLPSECQPVDPDQPARLSCERENARQFAAHFSDRWDGAKPFPAAYLYYDAVVLLAMGLDFGLAQTGELPNTQRLQQLIRQLGLAEAEAVGWQNLEEALAQLGGGTPVRYVGAAAEYEFDEYGAAVHSVFDTWGIENQRFIEQGALMASCPRNL